MSDHYCCWNNKDLYLRRIHLRVSPYSFRDPSRIRKRYNATELQVATSTGNESPPGKESPALKDPTARLRVMIKT